MALIVVLELRIPASSPTFILGNFGQNKLTVGLGIGNVGIDNGGSPAHLRHQVDELTRLLQVVKEATAENHIEDAILCEIADIVTQEGQIGQIGPRFDSLTIFEIALPNLDAQRIEASARQFDGIPTLEASKIDNPFPRGALGKKYPQKLLGELKQREIFHLVGLLRLRERSVVKPDVVCREAARHDSHPRI
jgi:hypothetical protein